MNINTDILGWKVKYCSRKNVSTPSPALFLRMLCFIVFYRQHMHFTTVFLCTDKKSAIHHVLTEALLQLCGCRYCFVCLLLWWHFWFPALLRALNPTLFPSSVTKKKWSLLFSHSSPNCTHWAISSEKIVMILNAPQVIVGKGQNVLMALCPS